MFLLDTEYEFHTCPKCQSGHAVPKSLCESARHSNNINIHCPFGHSWIFKTKEQLREDEVRRERDRLKQQLAMKDDVIAEKNTRIEMERRRVSAARGQVTKIKRRVQHGVCPCCNRTFSNLAAHMQTKHPEFEAA